MRRGRGPADERAGGAGEPAHRRGAPREGRRTGGLRPPHHDRAGDGAAGPGSTRQRVLRALSLCAPPVLLAAAIFWSSAQPDPFPFVPPSPLTHDKLVHFALYAVLAALVYRAARGSGGGAGRALIAAVAASALYGATDEWHQSFVPGRSPEAWDWVADLLGSAAGALAANRWLRRRRAAG